MPALRKHSCSAFQVYGDLDPVYIGWLDFRNNESIKSSGKLLSKKDIQIFTAAGPLNFADHWCADYRG